jgi:membrane protease YdiL (CAAX protease family)
VDGVTDLNEQTASGWYPDPAGEHDHRYWKDGSWTTWASVGGRAQKRPLPTRRETPSIAALPPQALWWALGGFLIAFAGATAASFISDSLAVSLVASTAVLYAGLIGTVWIVVRRYGTGSLVNDIGLRFRPIDLGAGLATSIAARALAATATVVVLAVTDRDSDSTNVQFDVFETSDAALYLALAIAVFAAPIVEEIFFRGLLQGALTQWLGVSAGIAAQGALFAATHYQVDAGIIENTTIFMAILAAGVVFGIAYQMTRRLGTSIVAHALFNLVPAIVILMTN